MNGNEPFHQQLDEVKRLYAEYRKLRVSTISSVLDCWAERRPVEENLDVMERIFPRFERTLKRTAEDVVRYLEGRDWRGCIANVVGEYGSGKTQLGFILKRMIRERGGAHASMITLDPFTDLKREIQEEIEADRRPLVLIVDEVDQLVSELERGERRKVEELADVARMLTEGSFSRPARGSVVLLLSKKARNSLRKDIALSNRLMDRAREFSISMSDSEREEVSLEAAKRIVALWAARTEDMSVWQYFRVIYPFMERLASKLSDTHEIGGVIKNLVVALEDAMQNLGHAPPMGRIEEGRSFEGLLERFLKEIIGKVPIKIRIGERTMDYLAVFSEEPLSVPGARTDAHYEVWTYDAARSLRGNRMVGQIGVEIKYGEYWRENREQLLRIMESYPLLLLCVANIDPDEQTTIENEMRAGGRAFAMITADPTVLRVASVMTEEGALRFLERWGELSRDVEEVLSVITTQSVRVEGKEVSEHDLAYQASSTILTSIVRDLKKAKKSVRTSTLAEIIKKGVEGVYGNYGRAPPELSERLILSILRLLERERLGRLSETGKSFSLDIESKRNIEEISSNEERRRKVEAAISEIFLTAQGRLSKLDVL